MRVVRGNDWRWGEQDGGAGTVGRIESIDPFIAQVFVRWPNGKRANYRTGAGGSYDLRLAPGTQAPDTPADATVPQGAAQQIEDLKDELELEQTRRETLEYELRELREMRDSMQEATKSKGGIATAATLLAQSPILPKSETGPGKSTEPNGQARRIALVSAAATGAAVLRSLTSSTSTPLHADLEAMCHQAR